MGKRCKPKIFPVTVNPESENVKLKSKAEAGDRLVSSEIAPILAATPPLKHSSNYFVSNIFVHVIYRVKTIRYLQVNIPESLLRVAMVRKVFRRIGAKALIINIIHRYTRMNADGLMFGI